MKKLADGYDFICWTSRPKDCEQARSELGLGELIIIDRDVAEIQLFQRVTCGFPGQAAVILRSPHDLGGFWARVENITKGNRGAK